MIRTIRPNEDEKKFVQKALIRYHCILRATKCGLPHIYMSL
jgi:hypothetical protein